MANQISIFDNPDVFKQVLAFTWDPVCAKKFVQNRLVCTQFNTCINELLGYCGSLFQNNFRQSPLQDNLRLTLEYRCRDVHPNEPQEIGTLRKLTSIFEMFGGAGIRLECIVPSCAEFMELQQTLKVWEENALLTLWKKSGALVPPAKTAGDIKEHIKNDSLLAKLSTMQGIDLKKSGINAIFPEIHFFSQLAQLELSNNQIQNINALKGLIQLTDLNLPNNQIQDIGPLEALTRLTGLKLQNNQIQNIRPLKSLAQLKYLDLSNNQIQDVSPLKALIRLNHLFISKNPIQDISALRDSVPSKCFFMNNLVLFEYYNSSVLSFMDINKNISFNNYTCQSNFSGFVQLVSFDMYDLDKIQEAFALLKDQDKHLIFEMVYVESKISSDDFQWGEKHVFGNMPRFCQALHRAIVEKFTRLSQADKNKVYEHIYFLSKPTTDDAQWGEHHFSDHVLLLIDAMEQAGV